MLSGGITWLLKKPTDVVIKEMPILTSSRRGEGTYNENGEGKREFRAWRDARISSKVSPSVWRAWFQVSTQTTSDNNNSKKVKGWAPYTNNLQGTFTVSVRIPPSSRKAGRKSEREIPGPFCK